MQEGKWTALFPLFFFVLVYFSASLYLDNFYAVPVLVVFLLSLVIAFLQFPKVNFETKLKAFTKGAGEENILLMILIFLLAGAFGQLSKDSGAVNVVIDLALFYLSPKIIVAGLFLVACFISLSLGTSVGTIAALAPLATGFNENIPGSMAVSLAAIVGGAMFGDNLSFISDTTIAATRTHGIGMKEKFKTNIKMVWPAALITFLIYIFATPDAPSEISTNEISGIQLLKIIPYLVVFGMALWGVNVIWTLFTGILLTFLIVLYFGTFTILEALQAVNTGLASMFELSMICLVIGGLVGLIRLNGGIDFLLHQVIKRIHSPKKAELGIALLTGLVNACIANNTLAIIITGPIAKEIALKNQVSLNRSASIMDTTSCFIQGIIPYGAQILTALALTSFVVSPLEVIRYLYYPFLTGICTLVFIGIRKQRQENSLSTA